MLGLPTAFFVRMSQKRSLVFCLNQSSGKNSSSSNFSLKKKKKKKQQQQQQQQLNDIKIFRQKTINNVVGTFFSQTF